MAEIKTKTYAGFRGVDFSQDPSMVDGSRSPDGENVIIDANGAPEKRIGWRVEATCSNKGLVRGIFHGVIGSSEYWLVHAGNSIYRFRPEQPAGSRLTLLMNSIPGNNVTPTSCVNLGGKMWLATGGTYLVYDGSTLQAVSAAAYIPTTLIACYPAGGGEFFEAINMLSPSRINSFIGDGTSQDYYLGEKSLASVDKVTVDGVVKSSPGDYSVNLTAGKVSFTSPPPAPLVGQEDNVVITYSKASSQASVINDCDIITTYGMGSRDRVVLSGNTSSSNYRNRDWISAYNDPSYIPDTGYSNIGSAATAIIGYAPIGAYQAIFKEDNGQDATIYLRSARLSDDGDVLFPVSQGVSGVGAVAKGGVGLIGDEPVFLSGAGLYGLTSNVITAERMVANRSHYVDPRLTAEEHLERAACVSWRGYFLIALNGRVYILDGRQNKTYWRQSAGEYVYECSFWTNVPARCWRVVRDGNEEQLWFGTADGDICRFNTDKTGLDRFSDDGEAIRAVWSTPADDDGDPTVAKTMLKKGCAVTLKPYTRSSCKVLLRTDQDPAAWRIRQTVDNVDLLDFNSVDFERFTFDTNEAAKEVWLRRKVKRYKRLQILVVSDGLNEGFAILKIVKHFVAGGFAKK